jgi:hypothetical protein
MRTALFTNFSNIEFIGYWDGKPKKFKPGQSLYMPDYLAKHFAKHLANRELLRKDENGNSIYKDGEKFTSPKRPQDTPVFMELFDQAYKVDETEEESLGSEGDDVDSLIGSVNKNHEQSESTTKDEPTANEIVQKAKEQKGPQNPNEPQIIVPPDFDEDDDNEESFEGKPVEQSTTNPELKA